jgi:hypothetical protein
MAPNVHADAVATCLLLGMNGPDPDAVRLPKMTQSGPWLVGDPLADHLLFEFTTNPRNAVALYC